MSDSSRRRIKCPCGKRQARLGGCYFGGYLYIHCPACNRKIQSEPIRGLLWPKANQDKLIIQERDKLLAAWHAT